MYKKAKNIIPGFYNSELIISFLENRYVVFQTMSDDGDIPEIFLKNVPSDILCTTIPINLRLIFNGHTEEYTVLLDVSKIKSIEKDSDTFLIKMENNPNSFPTTILIPKNYLNYDKKMITILKRLGRFDILLQIEE